MKCANILVFKTEDRQPERTLIRHSVQMLAEWNARQLLEPKFARIEAGTVIYITTCGGSELHQTYVGKKSEQWRKK